MPSIFTPSVVDVRAEFSLLQRLPDSSLFALCRAVLNCRPAGDPLSTALRLEVSQRAAQAVSAHANRKEFSR